MRSFFPDLVKPDPYFGLVEDDRAAELIENWADDFQHRRDARWVVERLGNAARLLGVHYEYSIHAVVSAGWSWRKEVEKQKLDWTLGYLQDPPADGSDPQPTKDLLLVSWIPIPMPASLDKSAEDQQKALDTFKVLAGLPDWYRLTFGSAYHVAGLAMAHFNATGKTPLKNFRIRTDTCYRNGRESDGRAEFYWCNNTICSKGRLKKGHLHNEAWRYHKEADKNLAVFPVGVIKLID